jgi:hypothetical protein
MHSRPRPPVRSMLRGGRSRSCGVPGRSFKPRKRLEGRLWVRFPRPPRQLVQAVLAFSCVGMLVVPTGAGALSISQFVVKPAGASLFYNFNVCGARGYRVTFQAALEPYEGGPLYRRTWHGFQRYRCAEWQLEAEDIWTEALWETQLTVYAHGQTQRSAVVIFDNTPG